MKHDEEIKAAIEEAFRPGKETVNQEAVDKACKAVLEKAADQLGGEGVFLKGILNPDMGGVSFRFKRPGIRQRVEHFMECKVAKPPRKKDVDDDKGEKKKKEEKPAKKS